MDMDIKNMNMSTNGNMHINLTRNMKMNIKNVYTSRNVNM